MSKSTLNLSSLTLDDSGQLISLSSVGSDTLDFEGLAGADITLTGITNILTDNIDTQDITRPNNGSTATLWNDGTGAIQIGTSMTANMTLGNAPSIVLVPGGIVTDLITITSDDTNVVGDFLVENEQVVGRRIFYAYDSIGNVQISSTPQTLDFDTVSIIDTGYTEAVGTVTIADQGLYEVSFTVSGDSDGTAGAARGRMSGQLELDTGGGFNAIPGSLTVSYQREQGIGNVGISVSKTMPVDVTADNSDIRVVFFQNTNIQWETLADASTFYIKRLSD